MRINKKILSIPPYISTSWKNIAYINMEDALPNPLLVITLLNGLRIEIPNLDQPILEAIFDSHALYLDQDPSSSLAKSSAKPTQNTNNEPLPQTPNELFMGLGLPLRINNGNLENFGGFPLQHTPDQGSTPDLPQEILSKIGAIAKALEIENPTLLPKAEPHCNCMFCQIARAIHDGLGVETEKVSESAEEEITADDLKFRSWDIRQSGEKLYVVTSPLDDREQYSVFLGTPLGCTCGEKNCEHI